MKGLEERLAALVGARPVSWERCGGGYSTAERYSVRLEDGRRVFVKASAAENMAGWLRREHEVYAHLRGSFMPRFEGFDDDGVRPLLALEDLSDADWQPDWAPTRLEAVFRALRELSAAPAPPNTGSVRDAFPGLFGRWRVVEEDPEPFLSCGLRSRDWLDRSLPAILAASDAAPVEGDSLLHLDVRSDNMCIADGRAVLVDWNWASLGNPDLDVAAWLPSVRVEGGPPPWELLPESGALACWIAGVWAAAAGLPPPETAPAVRDRQRRLLAVALDWIDRELLSS